MESNQRAKRSSPSKRTLKEDQGAKNLIPIKRYARCDSPEFSFFSKSQLEAREKLGLNKNKNADMFWPSPSTSPSRSKRSSPSSTTPSSPPIPPSPSSLSPSSPSPPPPQSPSSSTSKSPSKSKSPSPSPQPPKPQPVISSVHNLSPPSIESCQTIETNQPKTTDISILIQIEDDIQREIDRLLEIQEKFIFEIRYAFENLRKIKDIISRLLYEKQVC